MLLKEGFDVVSLDYRVLSEAPIHEIHADVHDGCRFVRNLCPTTPLILSGYSAGAYLALSCGTVDRAIDGICAFAGYGDLGAPWYTQPSEFFLRYKDVSHVPPRLAAGTPFSSIDDRIDLYVHLRQTGTWPHYALGDRFSEDRLRELSPLHNLHSRYPRTVLIHGTKDCDVPYSASEDIAASLHKASIPHRFITMREMDHDFYSKVEEPQVKKAWLDALGFLMERPSGV
jgi:acetyl esterase/lipase